MSANHSTKNEPLSDAGEVRNMVARWVITGVMTLETATRFGGRGVSPVDMPVLRDPKDGSPLLPGSTLAGALRSFLADRLAGYRTDEAKELAALLGGGRGDDQGAQSPVIVFDSWGRLPDDAAIEIRDSVKINADTGTAADRKKFDGEVLPAGTRFGVRLELVVSVPENEHQQVQLLTAALDGLTSGEINLGARRTRGMGRLTANQWRAKRYDLSQQQQWVEWLLSDPREPIVAASITPQASALEACQQAWPTSQTLSDDKRQRVNVQLDLNFSGGLLVRSPSRTADGPDVIHLTSGGRSVLPGTSTTGAIRNRALRIARVVLKNEGLATEFVEEMFGADLEGLTNPKFKPHGSALRVSENVVTDGLRQRPTRIRVDRFTQGVFENALFDEEPDYGGKVKLNFELREHPGRFKFEAQVGLLLLLVKDLMASDLAIGGTASVGRGQASGTATIQGLDRNLNEQRIELRVGPQTQPLSNAELMLLNERIKALQQPVKSTG